MSTERWYATVKCLHAGLVATTIPLMTLRLAVLSLAATAGCFGLSAGVSSAAPYCYETGPGYQKCVDGSSGGYFDPIYQGPKVYGGGNVPWVPSPPPAVYIPPPVYMPAIANVGGEDYVALATPSSNPTLAAYGVSFSQLEADRIALSQCRLTDNGPCQVAAQAYRACTAFAVGADGVIANGVGPDIASARAGAMNAGGQVIGAFCSNPPGRN